MRDRVLPQLTRDGFLAQLAAASGHDARAELAGIAAPTLVLTGTADRLIPPGHSDELARLIPGARLAKIEGGSHAVNVEQPDKFNRAVLEFLAQHPLDEEARF